MRKAVNTLRRHVAAISSLMAALLVLVALLAVVTTRDPYLFMLLLAMGAALLALAFVDRRALSVDRRVVALDRSLTRIEPLLRSLERRVRKAAEADRVGHDDMATALSDLHDALTAAEGRRRLDDAAREHRVSEVANRLDVRLTAVEGKDDLSELTALLNLFQVLAPPGVLTPPTDFSASPRTVLALVAEVLSIGKDLKIVECGSGASTVWLAAACRHVSQGSVLALEHDKEYARETRQALERCDLSDYAEVRHAPLRRVTLRGTTFRWYDPSGYVGVERIDVLFVNGPPNNTGRIARYPALPLLAPLLSEDALVVMDDASRSDEAQIVNEWVTAPDLGGVLTVTSRAGRALLMRWNRSQ
jgi:predicted O-methyltransferase YrrM